MILYVVLRANSFGTADVRGVFTDPTDADRLVAEEGGQALEAWSTEVTLNEVMPEED